jgi:hypothetical protein
MVEKAEPNRKNRMKFAAFFDAHFKMIDIVWTQWTKTENALEIPQ